MVEDRRTGRALVEHWTWAGEKGLVPKGSARTMALSCRTVLAIEREWEDVDVVALDIDEFSRRFKMLRASDYKPSSLGDYASRFRRGVLSYRDYLTDPSKWRYGSRSKRMSAAKPRSRQLDREQAQRADHPAVLQEYVYPFRKNVLATLAIPQDATATEIRRLIAWAETLAVDYEGQ